MHIEQLEPRQFLSAAPHMTAAIPTPRPAHGAVVMPSSLGLLNSNMIGSYSGQYNAGLISSGSAAMEITGQTGKSFSGTLTLSSDDGTNLSGRFKATVAKRLKYSFTFKSDRTSIKVSGILNLGYNGVAGTFSGRFEGQPVRRNEGVLVVYNFAGLF